MTEAGMYICQALGMSDEHEEPKPEVEREERRLERVRLVALLPPRDEYEDEDPGPAAA